MKRLGLFLWASAAPHSPCSRGSRCEFSPGRTGPGDASAGDDNRMDCA